MGTLLFALTFLLQSPDDAKLPTFEVATVKPVDPNARNFVDAQILPGGRLQLKSLHLTQLVAAAWMIPIYRVAGPKDINMYGYNVEALPPEDDSNAQPKVEVMRTQFPEISMLRLRALIIERFKLEYHLETREHLAYDLVVSKGGHGLAKRPLSNIPLACRPTSITSTGRTMGELALKLGEFYLYTDVYDKTGLPDTYDFSFSFEPVFNPPPAGDNPLPTIFDSIRQTLGLSLLPRKQMAKFVVIDHFKQPTPN